MATALPPSDTSSELTVASLQGQSQPAQIPPPAMPPLSNQFLDAMSKVPPAMMNEQQKRVLAMGMRQTMSPSGSLNLMNGSPTQPGQQQPSVQVSGNPQQAMALMKANPASIPMYLAAREAHLKPRFRGSAIVLRPTLLTRQPTRMRPLTKTRNPNISPSLPSWRRQRWKRRANCRDMYWLHWIETPNHLPSFYP